MLTQYVVQQQVVKSYIFKQDHKVVKTDTITMLIINGKLIH